MNNEDFFPVMVLFSLFILWIVIDLLWSKANQRQFVKTKQQQFNTLQMQIEQLEQEIKVLETIFDDNHLDKTTMTHNSSAQQSSQVKTVGKFLGVCARLANYLGINVQLIRFGCFVFPPLWVIYLPLAFVFAAQSLLFKNEPTFNFSAQQSSQVKTSGKFLGVCARLADYLGINVQLIRFGCLVFPPLWVMYLPLAFIFVGRSILQGNEDNFTPSHLDNEKTLTSPPPEVEPTLDSIAEQLHQLEQAVKHMESYVVSDEFELQRKLWNKISPK